MDYTLFQWYLEPGVLLTPACTRASFSLFALFKVDHSFSSYNSPRYIPITPLLFMSCPSRPIRDLVDLQVRSLLCTCTVSLSLFHSSFPSLLATIASIETSTTVISLSCILYSTDLAAAEKFDIQVCLVRFSATLFSIRLIGVCAFSLTLHLDDPRLDGCFHNKHACGFCKVYPGLDRLAWTGTAGGLTALYIHPPCPLLLATDRKANANWWKLRCCGS